MFKRKKGEGARAAETNREESPAPSPRATPSAKEGIKVEERKIIVGVLERPHLTEKASAAAKESTYVFVVARDANKHAVKRAVEARYGVGVRAVRIVNVPEKLRRRGRQIGWKSGYKKAYVTLREGAHIEIE